MAYLGYKDPETVLEKFKGGRTDTAKSVDEFIDAMLERYAHMTVRNFVFGVKNGLSLMILRQIGV